MGLFHRKNKKKSIMLDDKYTIRLEFADQFKPENNTQVAEAIQSASETEKNNGLPALDQTLPFATLKTAEDLFDNLRDVVAETAEPIEFDYLAIWLFDKTKKAKMGKPNSDDGNPHEYITLPGFKLNYDYQNLTKVIFETIFNLPENSDVSYDEKIEICQDLKQAYLESVNVGENEIARLPKKDEIEKGAVTLDVPAYSTSEPPAEAEPKKQYYDAKTHTFSDHPIEDDTPSTTETVAAKPVSTPAPAPIEKPKPAAKPTAPVASTVHETRSAVRAVTDAADDEQKLAREKGHVSAPQFEVAELDPVEPGQHGYVEYQLNQRKKTFNALLQNSAEKINDKNEKAILDLRESYKTKIEKAVANFRKQHKNDASNLHAKIANELYAAKQRELKAEYAKIDRQREDDLEQAERVYHQQQSKINSDSENNKQQAEQRLSKHYEQLANKKFDTEWAEIKRRNDDAETKLRQEKQRHYELQAREDAAQLRVNGLDLLQQMLTDETQELDDYRTQVTNEHLNAKQIVISENRSETEKQRIQAPFEELREANKTISDLKEQLSRTEALRATAENENAALKSDKQLLQEKNDSLMNEKLATAKELSTKDSKNKNDELNSTLSNYIKFKLATEMQPQQPTTRVAAVESTAVATDDHQTSKGHGEQYTKQMDGMLHGVKRLVVMFFLLLVLMICGFSYYTYRQHKENAARVEQITQTMNKKVAKAKQTNSNVVQESYKASSATDETQAALNALHANNGTELDKYKNEKYYALDKAIINNDAKAADAAVKAMGTDLAMNDRYRSTQAASLLNQAGDTALANKVSDANK
ncbi:hypothetical protein [Limosilactobacillus mucosae]|uniref:hypothetical protein n=1 Tax=Limosilactobacillus mucosae TaxID=97478 RepID=UPI0025A3ACBA|nr:hypothetical protein [Limosilactobacillus mucosae]MDM8220697.1 hypothetical protein [Limosilactobacillus mucosae]